MSASVYPVRVDARLQPGLSRWLWLVKWLLALPHYIILAFLWIAYVVLSVVAFVAILITGRYPRSIFEFNVGVLRWSWRVAYYTYGGLGTDQYPPFTLEQRPDYPARLEVAYPEHLSRGLALVKWWLLAIPHYLVLGLFLGGGWYVSSSGEDWTPALWDGGLIGVLVLIAAVVLLVTGTYPRGIFDLVLGLNRWVLRVAAYASLMTDRYPPFRLDQGGADPAGEAVVLAPPDTPVAEASPSTTSAGQQAGSQAAGPPPPSGSRWGAGRVIAVVVASLMIVTSLGLLAAGLVLLVADSAARDDEGFLLSPSVELRAPGYAVLTEEVEIRNDSTIVDLPERLIGAVKIEAEGRSGDVFVGVADSDEVERYFSGVAHSTLVDLRGEDSDPTYRFVDGQTPGALPTEADFWEASAAGPGTQAIRVHPEEGDWTVVVMNADGSATVEADVEAGATVPLLDNVAYALLGAGALLGAVGAVTLFWSTRRPR